MGSALVIPKGSDVPEHLRTDWAGEEDNASVPLVPMGVGLEKLTASKDLLARGTDLVLLWYVETVYSPQVQ